MITEDKKHRERLIDLPKACRKLNRYSDILPCKKILIKINLFLDSANSVSINGKRIKNFSKEHFDIDTYINGSYIAGPLPEDETLFIATQGPLLNAIESFWKIIVNHGVKLIVMLANLNEEGRKKCDMYWPKDTKNPLKFNELKISLENQDYIMDKNVIQRRCYIVHDGEKDIKYTVTHLQILSWPDHSVPEKEDGFKMIDLVVSYIDDYRNNYKQSPVLVHCR